MILWQDEIPPHSSKEIRIWLNEKFNGRWIGTDGPISWVLRCSDFIQLDFFTMGIH